MRTAEGGVNTGGGMDMTKYLSGSYYRLYTLHVCVYERTREERKKIRFSTVSSRVHILCYDSLANITTTAVRVCVYE